MNYKIEWPYNTIYFVYLNSGFRIDRTLGLWFKWSKEDIKKRCGFGAPEIEEALAPLKRHCIMGWRLKLRRIVGL